MQLFRDSSDSLARMSLGFAPNVVIFVTTARVEANLGNLASLVLLMMLVSACPRSVAPTVDMTPVADSGTADSNTADSSTTDSDKPEPLVEVTLDLCREPLPEQILAIAGVIEGLKFRIPRVKGVIDPDSFDELDAIAEVLVLYPHIDIEIRAHEDSESAEEHEFMGMKPTQKQANAVRAYLIQRGVDAARLTAYGYGESQPIADNATAEGRALNYRVELLVRGRPGCSDPASG
jgi:outer membrane protein OmpA-like peptidoglycan-associated protein